MDEADSELLAIGAFARASRLSPKALRLYDELGLLPPAHVDAVTGYRFYAAGQLEQARLVAWLRRLDMPLARIRQVCALDAAGAAREVRAFWAQVEADTAVRRDLASFLVGQLSRKDTVMTTAPLLEIRYAALSDSGTVRATNQDAVHAGARLLAVADGYGDGGAPAAAAAVGVLKRLESDDSPTASGLLNALQDAVEHARRAVLVTAAAGSSPGEGAATAPVPAGPRPGKGAGAGSEKRKAGTTLTAMYWTGSQLALVHIGDSRAYFLRDGGLFQITHDHTLVQSMVDQGRLTPSEAASHPQRALLARALTADEDAGPVVAETKLHDALPGDRYLLCSDGLSAVVPAEKIRAVLTSSDGPDEAVQELVALANASGGPDNVSCVVADVLRSGG
ncbi:protein phosphatase 2C domain-containing protein [Streptomyces sp. NPDC091272]|uniref:protein phosphatase 2C domain-containing protein n=1 Tax=Streptomyces sp. NPDC091272 TaxID=3365981 RepID=UPI0037F15541